MTGKPQKRQGRIPVLVLMIRGSKLWVVFLMIPRHETYLACNRYRALPLQHGESIAYAKTNSHRLSRRPVSCNWCARRENHRQKYFLHHSVPPSMAAAALGNFLVPLVFPNMDEPCNTRTHKHPHTYCTHSPPPVFQLATMPASASALR